MATGTHGPPAQQRRATAFLVTTSWGQQRRTCTHAHKSRRRGAACSLERGLLLPTHLEGLLVPSQERSLGALVEGAGDRMTSLPVSTERPLRAAQAVSPNSQHK